MPFQNDDDSLCEEFETHWKSGERPTFALFAAKVPPEHRARLLPQLVAVDVEYRRLRMEPVDLHDYSAFGEMAVLAAADMIKKLDEHQLDAEDGSIPAVTIVVNRSEALMRDSVDSDSLDLSFLESSTQPGSIGRLGHYEILEVLGKGGFGIVFKAFDQKLHRLVAIKAMLPQIAATSPPRKRFLREARAAAAIRHENVVQVHSVEEQPLPYLVMEFIDGETLQKRLDEHGPFDVSEVVDLAAQIASGLQAAHAHGLIHRDIKPGNILIEKCVPPKVKITDFGLARAADDASLTQSGVIAGTPLYMSPEQASGKDIDHRSDLFSLGSVIYAMACGHPPFRAATTVAVLRRVADDTPRPLKSILATIPEQLQTIVTRLLAKSPEDRYASADELARSLKSFDPNSQSASGKSGHSEPAAAPRRTFAPAIAFLLVAAIAVLAIWQPWTSPQNATDFTATTTPTTPPTTDSANTPEPTSPPPAAPGWNGWPTDAPAPAIAPFSWDDAVRHQREWARYLGVPVTYKDRFGIEFALIPPGQFIMGSTAAEKQMASDMVGPNAYWQKCFDSESDPHDVLISQPFYLATTETTQQQFAAVCGETPSAFSKSGSRASDVMDTDTSDWPVESIADEQLSVFIETLNKYAATETNTTSDNNELPYFLPTEVHWEFACRAGTTESFFWPSGDPQVAESFTWVGATTGGRPQPTRKLPCNPFGLFDVLGNVSELVHASTQTQNGIQPESLKDGQIALSRRDLVYRGGSWYFTMAQARSAFRGLLIPESEGFLTAQIGFRIALAPSYVKQSIDPLDLKNADAVGWQGWPADAPLQAQVPFTAAQAKQQQQQWADYLKVPSRFTNSYGMAFVLVPPGEFTLGVQESHRATAKALAELHGFPPRWLREPSPLRDVILTNPFYISETEVTRGTWNVVMAENDQKAVEGDRSSTDEDQPKDVDASLPAVQMQYRQAIKFCSRLSEMEDKTSLYSFANSPVAVNGIGYRLPTDAEWEFACRAGTTTYHWAGDDQEAVLATDWCSLNSKQQVHQVATLKPNPFGLYDVHGNVAEWVEDCWLEDPSFYRTNVNPSCPFPVSHHRLIRGGDVRFSPWQCPSGGNFSTLNTTPKDLDLIGCRVVLTIDCPQRRTR